MRELAPARDRRDRAGKVRRRINAPVPEEIAFPASISVVRGRWRGEGWVGGRGRSRVGSGERRRRRLGAKTGEGSLEFFNIPMPWRVALSLVLFHIITWPGESSSLGIASESSARFRFSGSAIPRARLEG